MLCVCEPLCRVLVGLCVFVCVCGGARLCLCGLSYTSSASSKLSQFDFLYKTGYLLSSTRTRGKEFDIGDSHQYRVTAKVYFLLLEAGIFELDAISSLMSLRW